MLETEIETTTGIIRLIDFMPVRDERPDIVRIVEGVAGRSRWHVDLVVRFDTGRVVPWVAGARTRWSLTAGPDALCLRGDIEVRGARLQHGRRLRIRAGERRAMALTWFPSHQSLPGRLDPLRRSRENRAVVAAWAAQCTYEGPWREAVGDVVCGSSRR